MTKQIAQGAEAKIILNEKNQIIKDRITKSYRIKELDNKLRKSRTKSEFKILNKSNKIIFTPKPIGIKDNKIILENIEGKKLSTNLDKFQLNKQLRIMNRIGKLISILHENNIIHGDLTTSNIILSEKINEPFIIDFGLSYISRKIEDKAVDLHLLKQALEAKHFKHHKELTRSFLQGYNKHKQESKKILERLKAVEKRGRYKKGS